jgi:ABC-2 type transport system permease protein
MPGPFPTTVDWQIARRGFGRYAAYPAATYAGLFTNTVFGFLRAYVLLAVFQVRDTVGGYDTAATLTYVWLTQALIATSYIWGWNELALRIRTGDIATDLIRPIHPLRAGLAFDYGRALYHALFRGIPPLLVGALVFHLVAPPDLLMWLAFAASVILAVGVSYAYRLLYNLVAFWMLDNRGPMMIASLVATLFSGFLIPVAFFPGWLAAIAHATPFPAMLQTPIDIFVGVTSGPAAIAAIATQLGWAVALFLAARAVFALGVRRLVVQGG